LRPFRAVNAEAAGNAGTATSRTLPMLNIKMEIEKYIITYEIGNDIPINPEWIREKLRAAVKELQAEIDKKPLSGQHLLTLK